MRALVAQLMAQLKETGVYQVPDALLEKMQSVFWSGCCDDAAHQGGHRQAVEGAALSGGYPHGGGMAGGAGLQGRLRRP